MEKVNNAKGNIRKQAIRGAKIEKERQGIKKNMRTRKTKGSSGIFNFVFLTTSLMRLFARTNDTFSS